MYLNRTIQYNIILCACAAAPLACLFRGCVCFFASKETITATFEARIAHMCVRVSWRRGEALLNNNNIIILYIMFFIIAFECIIIRLKRIYHYVYISYNKIQCDPSLSNGRTLVYSEKTSLFS